MKRRIFIAIIGFVCVQLIWIILLTVFFSNISMKKMLPIFTHTPLKYLVKYEWDISSKDIDDVHAFMTYRGEGRYKIVIKGRGHMVDFGALNEPCAWSKYKNITIGWLFELESVFIEEGVTNVGDTAFVAHPSLKFVELPSSLKEIGSYAFYNCYNLKEIHFDGTMEQWNEIYLGEAWNYGTDVTKIICHDGTVIIDMNHN